MLQLRSQIRWPSLSRQLFLLPMTTTLLLVYLNSFRRISTLPTRISSSIYVQNSDSYSKLTWTVYWWIKNWPLHVRAFVFVSHESDSRPVPVSTDLPLIFCDFQSAKRTFVARLSEIGLSKSFGCFENPLVNQLNLKRTKRFMLYLHFGKKFITAKNFCDLSSTREVNSLIGNAINIGLFVIQK